MGDEGGGAAGPSPKGATRGYTHDDPEGSRRAGKGRTESKGAVVLDFTMQSGLTVTADAITDLVRCVFRGTQFFTLKGHRDKKNTKYDAGCLNL